MVGQTRGFPSTLSARRRWRNRPAKPIRDSGQSRAHSPNVRVQSLPWRQHELKAWHTGGVHVRESTTSSHVGGTNTACTSVVPTPEACPHPGPLSEGEVETVQTELARDDSGLSARSIDAEAVQPQPQQEGLKTERRRVQKPYDKPGNQKGTEFFILVLKHIYRR